MTPWGLDGSGGTQGCGAAGRQQEADHPPPLAAAAQALAGPYPVPVRRGQNLTPPARAIRADWAAGGQLGGARGGDVRVGAGEHAEVAAALGGCVGQRHPDQRGEVDQVLREAETQPPPTPGTRTAQT